MRPKRLKLLILTLLYMAVWRLLELLALLLRSDEAQEIEILVLRPRA